MRNCDECVRDSKVTLIFDVFASRRTLKQHAYYTDLIARILIVDKTKVKTSTITRVGDAKGGDAHATYGTRKDYSPARPGRAGARS